MEINLDKIVTTSFILSFIATIIGALFKIMHWPGASMLLIIGLLSLAVFVITALYEVYNSKTINSSEKLMWTIGFLCLGSIAGLVYVLIRRKRVIRNQ
ncbi:hypothetical protein WMW71_03860 [Flavobacterium buctense]|uniref:Gliding motility protein GldL-like N-terminal domain-containing protein n=1 Tax=Flavobacterium buctense TaxID=1648146 RepID=A0ABU9E0R0_9FLAO|nr:hypothetical protein [Flavobacterium buctense]